MPVDNGHVQAKLALRRHFLTRYHTGPKVSPPIVLDACQGEGVLWRELRKEFKIGQYLGVDEKHRAGRLSVDSVRLLTLSGPLPYDVVDIDTYGSPWAHWLAVLERVRSGERPVTIFLTAGHTALGASSVGKVEIQALGLAPFWPFLSSVLKGKLRDRAESILLGRAPEMGLRVEEARIATVIKGSRTNARYLGLRLQPPKS